MGMDENKRIVEVNGIKLEIDMRYAKTIDEYKIGDPVKVLIKEYSSFTPYPGIIAGFDAFKERPTIIVAYLNLKYNAAEIKLTYITKDSADIEICPMSEVERKIDKTEALEAFEREMVKKRGELREMETKRDYFLAHFNKYFSEL